MAGHPTTFNPADPKGHQLLHCQLPSPQNQALQLLYDFGGLLAILLMWRGSLIAAIYGRETGAGSGSKQNVILLTSW